jgi:hypothetical protein
VQELLYTNKTDEYKKFVNGGEEKDFISLKERL